MDNIVIIGEYVKEYLRLWDIRFSPFWFSILHHHENGDHINLGDMDGSYIKYFTGVFHGGRKSATFSWECGSTGAERERERDGRTQVRGTVHNKGLKHIYTWWQIIDKLTNYLKVVTLLATLWHIYTANTNSHQPTQKSKKIAAQTKVHTTVLHSPRWWNMTHRNFLPTSLVGKGAVGGQRASERGPYISCIWPTCIGLT